jgi:putative hydrolase of the HAD superfamily
VSLKVILFDWGNTLMRDFPQYTAPMADWPVVEALPGAQETLRRLAPHYTLVLATSADVSDEAQIRQALGRVGLGQFIQRIYCFKNTGLRKSDPVFYTFILRDLGIHAAQALMVGDNFPSDVLVANQAGIPAVWLNSKNLEVKSGELYQTIHALAELERAIAV